jgi:hypothetical protein
MKKRAVISALAALLAAPALGAPIEGVIGAMALACMGDFARGGSHRDFQDGLGAQGFQALPRAEAERFLASAGGRAGNAFIARFTDTGDTLVIGFDASGPCVFSSPEASRSGTEEFLLRTYPEQIRSSRVVSTTESGLVDTTYALTVGGSTRLFVRFLGPGGDGGTVVWVLPEGTPPPTVGSATVTWP